MMWGLFTILVSVTGGVLAWRWAMRGQAVRRRADRRPWPWRWDRKERRVLLLLRLEELTVQRIEAMNLPEQAKAETIARHRDLITENLARARWTP